MTNLTNILTRKGLAVAMTGTVALTVGMSPFGESRGQDTPPAPVIIRREPAAVRVETDRAQIRVERTGNVAVPGRATNRTVRVVDLRPPDIGIWFDPAATDSLVVADIATTGPIAQLGFQEGDRILEVNHVKVTRETDLIKLLFATKARDNRVEVLIVRKNKEQVIVVEPALLLDHYLVVEHDPLEQLGLVIDDRYDDRVVVWKVIPRSPAFYGGIRPGDVITRFGDQRIVERKSLANVVRTVRPGVLAIEVDRARRARPIRIDVPRDYVGYTEERRAVTTEERTESDDGVRRKEDSSSGSARERRVERESPPREKAAPERPRERRDDR
jgi:predicted metalloprotease with PDZ domain